MTDVASKKYAIIINPDSESRHLQNVEDSVTVLEQNGYETHVFSPEKPQAAHDHYHNIKTTDEFLLELQKTVTASDEVLIYSSGHGSLTESGAPQLCINEMCAEQDVFSLLNFKQAKELTIIMDQCFSGGYAKKFATQPNTLFISPGSEGQSVVCGQFAPFFWSRYAIDYNSDGTVSFQERYQFALDQNHTETKSQFIPTIGYKDEGSTQFPTTVQNVTTATELSSQLATLKPGQFAFVLFSASWCGPCKAYKPEFESFAGKAQGQYLFIRTENEDLATTYNVTSYPTVKIIDHTGKTTDVSDRFQLFASLQYTTTTQAALYQNAISLLDSNQPDDHHIALTQLEYLSGSLNENQATDAIVAMQKMLELHGDKHSPSEIYPHYNAIYSDLENSIPRGTLMEIVDKYIVSALNSQTQPKTSDLLLLSTLAGKASPSMRERFVSERNFAWIDQIQNLDQRKLALFGLHRALDTQSTADQTILFSNWMASLSSFSKTTRMLIYGEFPQHFISADTIDFIIEDATLYMFTATAKELEYTEPHSIFIELNQQKKMTTAQIDTLLLKIIAAADTLPNDNLGFALTTLMELAPGASAAVNRAATIKIATYTNSAETFQPK